MYRLKKQELAAFAESAKKMLKTVENSVETENSNSLEPSVDDVSEKASKPFERAKILISVQDKDETKQIRMFMVLVPSSYILYVVDVLNIVVLLLLVLRSSLVVVCLKCYKGRVSNLLAFLFSFLYQSCISLGHIE